MARSALRVCSFLGLLGVFVVPAACGGSGGEPIPVIGDGDDGGGGGGGDTGTSGDDATVQPQDDAQSAVEAGADGSVILVDGGADSGALVDSGVDSGPACAPSCPLGATCGVDGDCASGACNAKKLCVPPSCKTGTSGIETCGSGEVGAPGAVHESCCRSLPLPVRTTRKLDRYEITTGRLRAFITALTAGGAPNVRAYAKTYAAAHPTSQLGVMNVAYPGLLDVLPTKAGPAGAVPLPVHLGAFPLDPINALDGCYIGPNAYGHATYWQPPADLKPLGVGGLVAGKPDGVRKYDQATLDTKVVNCVMPMFLAAFCAWDGGELARTNDYNEIWGRHPTVIGATTVFIPWAALLNVGEFNWRNGHGAACNPAWPGCIDPQPNYFYQFPLIRPDGMGPIPGDDDTAAISAPGRFPLDVTLATSAGGVGWYDVGGDMMEAAWPVGDMVNTVTDVCDVSSTAGAGDTACVRRTVAGVQRYAGSLPSVALVGYSYEGHQRRSEAYLANVAQNEALIAAGDRKPVTFQYGKVGGRCAR